MKLKNKIALITGASSGIGKGIAIEFAREGADIIVNFKRNADEANEVVKEIERLGSDAIAVKCDVSVMQKSKELIKNAVKRFGRIDILVNNAGIYLNNSFEQMTENGWDTIINTNLKGVFNCSKFAIADMIKRKSGKIINISSITALTGRHGNAAYTASKAGVLGFTKSLARELAPSNVNVNAILPGWTKTKMLTEPEKKAQETPLKKLVMPTDIGRLAVFLASSDSDCITGQGFVIDCGLTLK